MKQRDAIALTPAEQLAYIATARALTLCTQGPHGYPHAVAMWFAVEGDGTVWMSTYRKSQKAVNVRRNPKVALHIESGQTYDTLKGVLIRGDAEVLRRRGGGVPHAAGSREDVRRFPAGAGVEEAIRWQARKRVALKVTPRRVSSWDHSKLSGGY